MPIVTGVAKVIEVAMKGRIASAGSDAVNTAFIFHFTRSSILPAYNPANVETAFQSNIAVPIAAALNVRWSATETVIRDIMDATNAPVPFTEIDVGAIAGDSMASDNTAYILMNTGLRGRRYRGNKKLGPMSESDSSLATADLFNAGCVGRLNTIAAALLAGFADTDLNAWSSCVLSRTLSVLTPNPTSIFVSVVNQVRPNHRIGTLSRRKVSSVY